MFKLLLVVCFLILLANTAPLDKDSEASIINNKYTIDEKGNYKFRFETSNGIAREESGIIVNEGQPNEHILVIGQYSYYNTEGHKVIVEYIADENGYSITLPNLGTMTSLPASVVGTLLGK